MDETKLCSGGLSSHIYLPLYVLHVIRDLVKTKGQVLERELTNYTIITILTGIGSLLFLLDLSFPLVNMCIQPKSFRSDIFMQIGENICTMCVMSSINHWDDKNKRRNIRRSKQTGKSFPSLSNRVKRCC